LIFAVVLIFLSLVLPKHTKSEGTIIDFSIIAMVVTMASPIAWEHHYGILLSIYAFLLPFLLHEKVLRGRTFPYLSVIAFSYLLTSNFIPIVNKLAYVPYWNILLSYLFFGTAMLLVCLFVLIFDIMALPQINSRS
jgi:alpha-1,2-mannosyltransferase